MKHTTIIIIVLFLSVFGYAQQSFVRDNTLWVSSDNPKAKVKDFYPRKDTVINKRTERICPVCEYADCIDQAAREAKAKLTGIDIKILEQQAREAEARNKKYFINDSTNRYKGTFKNLK